MWNLISIGNVITSVDNTLSIKHVCGIHRLQHRGTGTLHGITDYFLKTMN